MSLSAWDDYPVHQASEFIAHTATSDRNFYDRYYFNMHPCDDDWFAIFGMGQYPNLGVVDAFIDVRRGDSQHVVRSSTPLADRAELSVGPFRIEVIEPLRKLRVIVEPTDDHAAMDVTWEGHIPAVEEPRQFLRSKGKVVFDTQRLAQTGFWSGTLSVGGNDLAVTPDRCWGTRDRSWGVRPVGEGEPPGIQARNPPQFYWVYAPMQFDDFSILVIIQEDAAGHRILEEAVRVRPDGEPQELGRPEYRPTYRPGTRDVDVATLTFSPPGGEPIEVRITPVLPVSLMVGTGYGLEPDWRHGMYQGPDLVVQGVCYDLGKPEDAARMWGMIDAVAAFECKENGVTVNGSGLFEYWAFGSHAPTGLD
jgi:hypothetical protein